MKPTLTNGTEKRWSVFAGGTEITDSLTTFSIALSIAEDYEYDGYDEIILYQYDTKEEIVVC